MANWRTWKLLKYCRAEWTRSAGRFSLWTAALLGSCRASPSDSIYQAGFPHWQSAQSFPAEHWAWSSPSPSPREFHGHWAFSMSQQRKELLWLWSVSISYRQSDSLGEHSFGVQGHLERHQIKQPWLSCSVLRVPISGCNRKNPPKEAPSYLALSLPRQLNAKVDLDGLGKWGENRGQQAYLDTPSLWYWPPWPKDAFWNTRQIATS